MPVYLQDIPLSTALDRLNTALEEAGLGGVLGIEHLPVDEHLLGRVLAEPIWAKISSPHYHASAMDGFAVRAAQTAGAGPVDPITLPVPSMAVYLDTGDPLPAGFDSVIPIENAEALDAAGQAASDIRNPVSIRLRSAAHPWSHVRPLGEDVVATQLILAEGRVLRAADLGAIAASGQVRIAVSRPPRTAIIPTGTELVPLGTSLKPGAILEYNSIVMAAQIKAMGGQAERFAAIPDDIDLICERVSGAIPDFDLVLLNAGSSAGSEDFSAQVVERLGSLLVHGVAVRPGHPVILGMLQGSDQLGRKKSVPIVGVPGFPVSAALTLDIFVEPLMARWLGRPPLEHPVEEAAITRKIASSGGDDEYIRVVAGRVGERMLAVPLSRGAGTITSLSQADGLVVIPRGEQGIEPGQKVNVHLLRPPAEIKNTIFCIGSHDVALDLLARHLSHAGRRLISANVGSQGGLMALRKDEAHVAGSHLLDPRTGKYNFPYLAHYAGDLPVRLVTLTHRSQGLMVRRGNPMGLGCIADLAGPDVRFINRQRGAGTRVLLDYQLSLLGIPAERIMGYNQEEYTHLAVAAAVASGRADCALGIAAAAQALDLDFVPLFQERFDLVIPEKYWYSELLAPLLAALKDPGFRKAVAALPGYDIAQMGEIPLED